MSIPLPELMRKHRVAAHAQNKSAALERAGLAMWVKMARTPAIYRHLTRIDARLLNWLRRWPGLQKVTPFLGRWLQGRALMHSSGDTFQARYRARHKYE